MHIKVFGASPGPARVALIVDSDELLAIMNCIGETHEALEDWEFQTRVGVTRDVTKRIRSELRAASRELPPDE